ncbi:amidohydrolase family protein [Pseudoalteromonas phenolica]|uniref:amidohydrolase family protein n=1 Tax=Pseudoalteromonas phenolica TaxID=161398 RepID=UPI00110A8E55|nr:amidohydrolase family protein [Pseudoalteromonas phenolica]TMO52491.1 amidohydrolase [Pseudoalteromonas phenolica]
MKKFNLSLVTGALLASSAAFAQVTAITNATVHTMTDKGVLKDATVLIEDGKIIAINPSSVSADVTIDAQDKILTPGFIGSMNQVGLVEVGAVSRSNDGYDKKASAMFDASTAFNPRSSLIPYARKGGLTQNVVVPHGGESIFSGLSFVTDLSGDFESVTATETALIVRLGAKSSGSRAVSLKQLVDKLEGQQKKLAKEDKKDDKKDEPSKEQKVLTKVLKGELPVITKVSRASDILELLKVKKQFGLNLVLWNAEDAPLVKEQISESKTPVILSAVSNLPSDFDSLHASLETAGELEKAGVKVLLAVGSDSSHNVYQLRFDAGIAVANGMSHDGALKAVTSNIADVFGLNAGKVAKGQRADLVLWSADPFEFSTSIESMWINGEKVNTNDSRHDKLRDRYNTPSDMPRAYTK